MSLKRFDDWPERLHEFLKGRSGAPFSWGRNDCVLFVADAVEVITGVDLAADFRDSYDSAFGAARIMREEFDSVSVDQIAAQFLPWCPTNRAGRGDVVAVETDDGVALGICVGDHAACAGREGIYYMPRYTFAAAWRV